MMKITSATMTGRIIMLNCIVTLILLGLSIIMKIKGQAASLTDFAFVMIGVYSSDYLRPTLVRIISF
jgi:hypothetical protein